MKRELGINGSEHRIEVFSPAPACRFSFDGGAGRDLRGPRV
jgi:hypothetical protein